MKNNLTKKVAKKTAKVLDSFLSMDANSAYQSELMFH